MPKNEQTRANPVGNSGYDTSPKSITRWFDNAKNYFDLNFSPMTESAAAKEAGLAFLAKYNLPRYRKIKVELPIFFDNPDLAFTDLEPRTNKYYISLLNKNTGERLFFLDRSKEAVSALIQEKINEGIIRASETILILSEYYPNDYGGNITIDFGDASSDDLGRISLEMVEGKHANLTEGQKQLISSASSDSFTNILEFKANEANLLEVLEPETSQAKIAELKQELLDVMRRAINLIPQEKEENFEAESVRFGSQKVNGYYEFIVYRDEQTNRLEIIFIDARPGKNGRKYSNVNAVAMVDKGRDLIIRQEAGKNKPIN